MTKNLIIANYKKSKGGISGQVDILIEKLNMNNIRSSLFNTKRSNFKRLFLPIELYNEGRKYDIFHVHGCSYSGFYPIVVGVIIGGLLKKKIIITYHGGGLKRFIDSYPLFIKYIFDKADIITIPSQYLLKILNDNNIKAVLLPNIIREDNVNFKKRKNFRPKLITTRSLEPVYNIPLVIMAFDKIKKKYCNATLQIVGNGSLSEDLNQMVKNNKLDGVKFEGNVDNFKIGAKLNEADIYINPTTADNMPLSLFEAFACGLPVISTNVGGIPDFIGDNVNGFLIESDDIQSLVDKIEFILMNQVRSKSVVDNAFQTFQQYTWSQLKNKYILLYK